LSGLRSSLKPRGELMLKVQSPDGSSREIPLLVRIDTPTELEYFKHRGILPYVLRQIAKQPST
jgi:aconitate hydratase